MTDTVVESSSKRCYLHSKDTSKTIRLFNPGSATPLNYSVLILPDISDDRVGSTAQNHESSGVGNGGIEDKDLGSSILSTDVTGDTDLKLKNGLLV